MVHRRDGEYMSPDDDDDDDDDDDKQASWLPFLADATAWQRADSPQGVDGDRSVWNDVTPKIIAQAYGNQFHPFAETGRFEEIVNQSERVVASNVFQEVDFPAMTKGRVALLGDGELDRFTRSPNALPLCSHDRLTSA